MSKEAMKLALEGAANYIDALGGDSRKYRQTLANEALDKKAENARELGLDYEPAQDSGVVTAGGFDPRTQRTWVGLTDEERNNLWREVVGWGDPSHDDEDLMKAIEAKLKEKNT